MASALPDEIVLRIATAFRSPVQLAVLQLVCRGWRHAVRHSPAAQAFCALLTGRGSHSAAAHPRHHWAEMAATYRLQSAFPPACAGATTCDAAAHVCSMAYDARHDRVVTGGWDCKTILWTFRDAEGPGEGPGKGNDHANGSRVCQLRVREELLPAHGQWVCAVAVSDSGCRVGSFSHNGSIRVHDCAPGAKDATGGARHHLLCSRDEADPGGYARVGKLRCGGFVGRDGSRVCVGRANGDFVVFDIRAAEAEAESKCKKDPAAPSHLIVPRLDVYDTTTVNRLNSGLVCCAFAPAVVIMCSQAQTVLFWRHSSGNVADVGSLSDDTRLLSLSTGFAVNCACTGELGTAAAANGHGTDRALLVLGGARGKHGWVAAAPLSLIGDSDFVAHAAAAEVAGPNLGGGPLRQLQYTWEVRMGHGHHEVHAVAVAHAAATLVVSCSDGAAGNMQCLALATGQRLAVLASPWDPAVFSLEGRVFSLLATPTRVLAASEGESTTEFDGAVLGWDFGLSYFAKQQ
jgi:hypothetical protein